MARLAGHAEPEDVMAHQQERGAEALDLQRARQLHAEAVPDPVGGEDHERHEQCGDDTEH